jgi:hypothetical protein
MVEESVSWRLRRLDYKITQHFGMRSRRSDSIGVNEATTSLSTFLLTTPLLRQGILMLEGGGAHLPIPQHVIAIRNITTISRSPGPIRYFAGHRRPFDWRYAAL